MGLFSKITPARVLTGMFTMGGSEVANAATGGKIYNEKPVPVGQSPLPSMQGSNEPLDIYGNVGKNLGAETENYFSRIKGDLDKNVAKADVYNQQAGRERAISNAKAGLSGVDTTAMNEQSLRNAQFGASAINQAAKSDALNLYGTSIGNIASGINQQQENKNAFDIANKPITPPDPNAKFNLLRPNSWF